MVVALILFYLLSFNLFVPFSHGLPSNTATSSLSRSSGRSFTRSGTTSRSRSTTLTVTRSGSPTRCRSATTSLSLSSTTSITGSLSRRPSLTVSVSTSRTVSRSPTTTSCPPGYAGLSCKICGPGTYSSSTGSPFCLPCPAGVFGATSGLTSAACSGNCTAAPGYFCPSGSTSPTPNNLCTAGAYCAGGSAANVTCYPVSACTVAGLSTQPPCFWNVSTLAGNGVASVNDGSGTTASFNAPLSIWRLFNGSLAVTDSGGGNIRVISSAAVVNTLVSGLNSPTSVVENANGTIFIADRNNNRIQRYSNGVVNTFLSGLGNPWSVTISRLGPDVFFGEGTNGLLKRASPSGSVSLIAGSSSGYANGLGTNAKFAFPIGIIADLLDNIYVADYNNHCVRLTNPLGIVTTLAGNGSASFSDGFGTNAFFRYPCGISMFNAQYLVIADQYNAKIRLLRLSDNFVTTLAGSGAVSFTDGIGISASFNQPSSSAVSGNGVIFVSDLMNNRIRQLTCVPCPASYYCSSGYPIICPSGSYCPISSINPTPCPSGTYNPTTGASTNSSCLPCTAIPGYFCPAGSSSPSQSMPCNVGAYCAGGSAVNVTCYPVTACTVAGLSAQPPCYWNVSTLAGSGVAGWADGQGGSALFSVPIFLSVHPSTGIIYVAENGNNRVRSVSMAGFVGTIAGSGATSFADGQGTNAMFNELSSSTVDAAGNIYAADFTNNRVRKIFPAGNVITIAGNGIMGYSDGVGSSAIFNGPTGIALDSSASTAYIVEQQYGHRIRSLNLLSFSVATLAGSGVAGFTDNANGILAQFNAPSSAVWHPNGILYVSDGCACGVSLPPNNNRIRVISISSTAVTTLAGSGVAGSTDGVGTLATFNMPRGIAIDPSFSTLYVAEQSGYRIRSISISTKLVLTIAGSGSNAYANGFGLMASFTNTLIGVTSTLSGILYASDANRIRQLTCVPCPASYYCASGAPIICPIGSYCPLSSLYPTPCPAGSFGSTTGLSTSACSGNCTAAPGYFCPPGSTSPTPSTLCNVGAYCAGGSAANVTCSPVTACTVAGLSAQPPCYWNVSTLAGNGVAATLDGQGTLASIYNPFGVSTDATVKSSNVYVSEYVGHRIRSISPSGTVTTLAGSGTGAFADGLGAAASLNKPANMAVDPQGFIYLAEVTNNRIRKISPSGLVSTIAGSGASGGADGIGLIASFSQPIGLAFTPDWTVLYVLESSGHRIRKLSLFNFAVTTLAGSGVAGFADGSGILAQFNAPNSLVYHPSGILFVADGAAGTRIRRVEVSTALVTTLAGNGVAGGANGVGTLATFNLPRGIALNGLFSVLYVVEDTGARIRSIDIQTAVVQTIAGTGVAGYTDGFGVAAAFNRPLTVTVSNEGALFVADYQTSRVRILTCVPCPASYYCSSGAPVICPAAFYCPLSSINPTPAPPGTYSSSTGASSPTPCFPGTYNPLSGQTSCLQCEPGYFCPSSSNSMSPCGISNYCPRGSSSPTPCPLFMAVDATLGPANGPAYDVDTASCLAHCYNGGPGQTSRC